MGAILGSLLIGALFGAGLAISGMMNPAKVLGFLDIAGSWDPTLAVVMASALAVTLPAFFIARRRSAPLLANVFSLPTRKDIDVRLIGGAVLFGVGWGMAGFCPGPALAALSTGVWQVGVFVVAMLAGMVCYALVAERG